MTLSSSKGQRRQALKEFGRVEEHRCRAVRPDVPQLQQHLPVAARLGARSLNAYARYEQGRTTPSVQKLSELLSAVVPDWDFVLIESRTRG
jgi:transcriptional regulator with XRE-family HTH domain